MTADMYITSVNGMAETGELINIDGNGNRVASSLYGHKKVWFIVGRNKLAPTYDEAPWRITLRWTTIGITVLAALMIVWTLLRVADSKKHPDQYNVSKRKPAKAK